MPNPPPRVLPTIRPRSLAHHALSVLRQGHPATAEQVADFLAAPTRGVMTSNQEVTEALDSLTARGMAAKHRSAGKPNAYEMTDIGLRVLDKMPHPRA